MTQATKSKPINEQLMEAVNDYLDHLNIVERIGIEMESNPKKEPELKEAMDKGSKLFALIEAFANQAYFLEVEAKKAEEIKERAAKLEKEVKRLKEQFELDLEVVPLPRGKWQEQLSIINDQLYFTCLARINSMLVHSTDLQDLGFDYVDMSSVPESIKRRLVDNYKKTWICELKPHKGGQNARLYFYLDLDVARRNGYKDGAK